MDWDFNKIFYPTREVYLMSGPEAIESFSDRYRRKETGDEPLARHAVIVMQNDVENLGRISRQGGASALAAADALSFINKKRDEHVSAGGKAADTPISLGDNLFLVISTAPGINELRETERRAANNHLGTDAKSALDDRLQVMCQFPDEAILHSLNDFRTSIVRFDKVDPNIRKEGIKYIPDDALYSHILERMNNDDEKTRTNAFPLSLFSDMITKFYPNQYIVVTPERGGGHVAGQVIGSIHWNKDRSGFTMEDLEFRVIRDESPDAFSQGILGIRPKDIGQQLYLHALSQGHISRVFVTGEAACGKTLIGYAGALYQTLRRKGRGGRHAGDYASRFQRIFITKSNDLIGGRTRERGFLPGTEEEKILADIQSYVDAHNELDLQATLTQLAHGFDFTQSSHGHEKEQFRDVFNGMYAPLHGGLIEIQDYAKWRGRTLSNAVIFMDEAQNLFPAEFKHLNQRVGQGSQVIISGDYEHQMDNARMGTTTNGLFQGLRHYLGEPYVAVIHLEGSYRDMGAEHAGRMRVYR